MAEPGDQQQGLTLASARDGSAPAMPSLRFWWRAALMASASAAVALGTFRLFTALPWGHYFPYYWDGASVLESVQRPGFLLGTDPGLSDYALSKYGYSALVWVANRFVGFDAPLYVETLWFLVLLIAPFFAPVFRTSERFGWFGYSVYAAGVITLPFVHKYVGMANPTMQSTALWLLLVLFYARRRGERGELIGWAVVPGLLCAALALTDYKWIPFVVVGVAAVEILDPLRRRHWDVRESWRSERGRTLRRVVLILFWTPALLGIVAWANPAYREAVLRYAVSGNTIDALRPAVSWNLLIFLWVLGGFWAAVWTVWHWWSEHRRMRRTDAWTPDALWPGRVLAILIVVLFSGIMWPRSARMFAPAVVFGILVFARRAQQTWDRCDGRGTRQVVTAVGLTLVMLGFAWRSVRAGDCHRLPGGIEKMARHIVAHREQIGRAPVGTYMLPSFALATGPAIRWFFPPVRVTNETDWIVTSDFLDPAGIREQQAMRRYDWRWTVDRFETRGILGESGVKVASFRNEFYTSAGYWCESSFSDGELLFILDLASKEKEPTWDLRYVGGIFGRALPDTTGMGTGR
ncbi:MAG: hypothetical protein AB1792_04760 [Candidatus Zixiibacteriota bacterium]